MEKDQEQDIGLPRLYSVDEVLAIFPENHKPGRRRLIEFAKREGCCRKLGRAVAFTKDDVQKLLDAASMSLVTRRAGRRVAHTVPKRGSAYAAAMALLTQPEKRKPR